MYIIMYVYICELHSLRLAEHWRKFDPDFTIDPVYEVMTVSGLDTIKKFGGLKLDMILTITIIKYVCLPPPPPPSLKLGGAQAPPAPPLCLSH